MSARSSCSDRTDLQCPSALPEMPDAVAFGLVEHGAETPSTAYLEARVPLTPELIEMAAPLLPAQVFRFSAPCQRAACSQWDGACTLADRIVKLLPVASLTLPPCQIRADCRWYAEQGREACRRCPQIVTQSTRPSELLALASRPPARHGGAREPGSPTVAASVAPPFVPDPPF